MEDIRLNLSSEQLLKIIDNCWDSILVLEKNSKIVYTNNSFLMLVGYAKEKVIGTPFELFLESRYQEAFEQTLQKIESSDMQSFIKVICMSKDKHEVGLHIALQQIAGTELVMLNIKQTHELTIKENNEIKTSDNKYPSKSKKEDDGVLGKTFGWLDEANKAIDSIFHHDEKPKKKEKKAQKKVLSSKYDWLPKGIDELKRDDLREYVKNDIDTYRSIDYSKYTPELLVAAKEWHTWQVCIMLKLYKMGDKIFISDKEEIFPDEIKELSKHNLEQVIQSIIKNLKIRANMNAKKEVLKKDAKWSAFEVSCLIYFILE